MEAMSTVELLIAFVKVSIAVNFNVYVKLRSPVVFGF
jgi:hypothetical protein